MLGRPNVAPPLLDSPLPENSAGCCPLGEASFCSRGAAAAQSECLSQLEELGGEGVGSSGGQLKDSSRPSCWVHPRLDHSAPANPEDPFAESGMGGELCLKIAGDAHTPCGWEGQRKTPPLIRSVII